MLQLLHDPGVPLPHTDGYDCRFPNWRFNQQQSRAHNPGAHTEDTTRACHREGPHSPAAPSLTLPRLTPTQKAPCPPRAGKDRRSLVGAHMTFFHPRGPQLASQSSSVLAAYRHTLIPQAFCACRCPEIPAHTFHLPDTAVQTWGLLLAGKFNLELSGKYTQFGGDTGDTHLQPAPGTWAVSHGPTQAISIKHLTHSGPSSS